MRSLLTTVVFATALLGSADAINLSERRSGQAPRVVQHDIQRRHVENPVKRDQDRLRKRDGTVSESLTNEQTLYFMSVSIGTPSQNVQLHLDTGSSDLWVNTPSSRLCEERSAPCSVAGVYSANQSSTYHYLDSAFNISYADGSGSYGDYVTDTVKFADVTINSQQFGIGYESSSLEGIIGIGYPLNEVSVSYGYGTYPNVPQRLVDDGYISTNAYSLWLNDLSASQGNILFGGVNTGRYTGELQTLPIIPVDGHAYALFLIGLTDIGYNGNKGSIASNIDSGALLDSGSSLMYLPDDIANNIFSQLGVQYDSSQGAAFVDCSMQNSDDTIDFTFSSPTISIPMSELIIVAAYQDNNPVCIVGIGYSGDSMPILGDTFLRSAYIVYDLENNEISLAQTDFTSSGNNILEITKNSGVPSATMVQNAVTSVAQASNGAIVSGAPSASPGAAVPTAAIGYNLALLGAAGAVMFAL